MQAHYQPKHYSRGDRESQFFFPWRHKFSGGSGRYFRCIVSTLLSLCFLVPSKCRLDFFLPLGYTNNACSFGSICKGWRRIEAVITGLTRNQFAGNSGTWVRIPPSPPHYNPNLDTRLGLLLFVQKASNYRHFRNLAVGL